MNKYERHERERAYRSTMRSSSMLILIAMAMSVIIGCASMATPKTLDEQIYYASSVIVAINNSAADLLERKRISKEAAIEILKKSGEAQTMLGIARTMNGSGDETGARDSLTLAQDILLELERYLQQQENSG